MQQQVRLLGRLYRGARVRGCVVLGRWQRRCGGAEVQRVHRCRGCAAWCGGAEVRRVQRVQTCSVSRKQPRSPGERRRMKPTCRGRRVRRCMARRCGGACMCRGAEVQRCRGGGGAPCRRRSPRCRPRDGRGASACRATRRAHPTRGHSSWAAAPAAPAAARARGWADRRRAWELCGDQEGASGEIGRDRRLQRALARVRVAHESDQRHPPPRVRVARARLAAQRGGAARGLGQLPLQVGALLRQLAPLLEQRLGE